MNHARLPDMHYPRFMVIAHAHYLLKPWQEVVWSNDICCLDPRLNRVNPPRHAPPSLARNDRAHTLLSGTFRIGVLPTHAPSEALLA